MGHTTARYTVGTTRGVSVSSAGKAVQPPVAKSIQQGQRSSKRLIATGALAWVAMLGVDFLMHGGLLAWLYVEPDAFLLPPLELFVRIPFGYAAFGVLTVLLVWLMHRQDVRGWRAGLRFGLTLGALIWAAFALALFSTTPASLAVLAGWFVAQTLQLGIGGAVAGQAQAGVPLRGLLVKVLGGVFLLVVVTIMLQSTGLAPTTRL